MSTPPIKKVRAPKGFKFYFYQNERGMTVLWLWDCRFHQDRAVGWISLPFVDSKKKMVETHSNLDEDYHGKGLGAKMYLRAIQWALENGYKISSSDIPSADAQRVWKSKTINSKYRVRNLYHNWKYSRWYVLGAK